MKRYAYQAPDHLRPEPRFNFREAANKPYMGITAFLNNNEPWLVIDYDGRNHILEDRNGNTIKLNTPFNWKSATDKSALVAAARAKESPIPGTLHYSANNGEWYLRIGRDIFDIEDVIDSFEKTSIKDDGDAAFDFAREQRDQGEPNNLDDVWYDNWAGPEEEEGAVTIEELKAGPIEAIAQRVLSLPAVSRLRGA
jgi:hypothetical protein